MSGLHENKDFSQRVINAIDGGDHLSGKNKCPPLVILLDYLKNVDRLRFTIEGCMLAKHVDGKWHLLLGVMWDDLDK